jgi:hypothetical protein
MFANAAQRTFACAVGVVFAMKCHWIGKEETIKKPPAHFCVRAPTLAADGSVNRDVKREIVFHEGTLHIKPIGIKGFEEEN